MFDHVKFGVSDFAASRAFYLKALEPSGVRITRLARGISSGAVLEQSHRGVLSDALKGRQAV